MHLQAPIRVFLCPGTITNEQEKRHVYDKRVKEVEKACFSPLVFSTCSGMGPSATVPQCIINWFPFWLVNRK